MLVQDLFSAILEVIGVTTLDEVPEASDMQKCKRHMNLLLDSLSARRLIQLSTKQEGFPLVTGKRVYTIGVGGDFNTSLPISISSAFTRDTAGINEPVDIITLAEYEITEDTGGSRVERIYFDAGQTQSATPLGTISCDPTPLSGYTLFIDQVKYLTEFVNLTDPVTFPPAYRAMLVYNGALALWRPMGRTGPPPPDIRQEADRTMRIVENMNSRSPVAKLDLPGSKGGQYDIISDTYL